eukprot:8472413-Ditylum_brightwellii.AAC.1
MNEANDDDNDAASRALFSNEDLVKSFLAPMLQHTEAFQLAQTSTSCRNGVYAFGLVELEKLVSNIRFVHEEPEEYEEEEYEEEGAALFGKGIGLDKIRGWETAHDNLILPSHVQLLLRTIGEAKYVDQCGYSPNPANTW